MSKHRVQIPFASRVFTSFGYTCYLLAVLLTAWLAWNITTTEIQVRQAADHSLHVQQTWPSVEQQSLLDAARAYNRQTHGQQTIQFGGNGMQGGRQDEAYMRVLNDGTGIMGVLDIPVISFHQPIYHTTDDDALESGVGHMYGTSLPIGDKNTHAGLAAHTGSGDRTDFTRIRELHVGSFFYLTVLGKRMGYQVDRIRIVDPDDVRAVTDVTPNEARVTLITCDPPLLNTKRLLVSGVRKSIPDPIPNPESQVDVRLYGVIAVFTVSSVGVVGLIVWRVVHRRRK